MISICYLLGYETIYHVNYKIIYYELWRKLRNNYNFAILQCHHNYLHIACPQAKKEVNTWLFIGYVTNLNLITADDRLYLLIITFKLGHDTQKTAKRNPKKCKPRNRTKRNETKQTCKSTKKGFFFLVSSSWFIDPFVILGPLFWCNSLLLFLQFLWTILMDV